MELVGHRTVREVLHHQVGLTVTGEAGPVDGDDVRVPAQRPHGAPLSVESVAGPLVELTAQNLDGDRAIEVGLGGAVDHAEAASPDLFEPGHPRDAQIRPLRRSPPAPSALVAR